MRRVVLTSLALLALSLGADTAHACECPPPPVDMTPEKARAALAEDFNKALAIFSGEVIELDTFKVKFKVDKIWKGGFGGEIVMSTGVWKHEGGGVTRHGCAYSFKLGDKYLVYAYGDSAAEMMAGVCTRTKELGLAEQEVGELDEVSPHEKRNRKPEE